METETVESSLKAGSLFAERYAIEKLIGMGGMGEVYLALDTLLNNEPIALKIIHSELSNDEKNVKRFLREAQLTRKVSHENIARTFDASVYDGRFYFSLEFLDGTVLSELLKTGTVPFYEASRIMQQVCDGLEVIHKAGIVHRDLKPSNLILVRNGVVKITDFGIARPGNSDLTKSSEVLGSAPYMAPELWTGTEVGAASDMYALGVLFYEMLTGVLPLDGDTAAELMFKHLEVTPTRPSSIEKSVPVWVDDIVLKLLNKKTGDRFASARELSDALERGIAGAAVSPGIEDAPPPSAVFDQADAIVTLSPEVAASSSAQNGVKVQMYPYGGTAPKSSIPPLAVPALNMIPAVAVPKLIWRMSFALAVILVLYQATVSLLEPYLAEIYLSGQLPSFKFLRVLATVGLIVTTGLISAMPLYFISSPMLGPVRGLSMFLTIITRLSVAISLVLVANAGMFLASYGIDSKYTLGPYLLSITQHVVVGMAQVLLLVPAESMGDFMQLGKDLAINSSSLMAGVMVGGLSLLFTVAYALYIGFMAQHVSRTFRVPMQLGVGIALFLLITLETVALISFGVASQELVHVMQIGQIRVGFSGMQLMLAGFNWFALFGVLMLSIRLAAKRRARIMAMPKGTVRSTAS